MAEPASRTYGGVDAADRAVRRRAALIEAGLDLMSSVGTDKTTMTAVCAAAGLTERYFYESFRTKSDLLLAVLDSVADEVRSAAIHAVSSTDGDVADRVRAALSAVVSIMLSDPRRAGSRSSSRWRHRPCELDVRRPSTPSRTWSSNARTNSGPTAHSRRRRTGSWR